MMTQKDLHDEFWLLTKSVLQDSRISTEEATVLKRWLEEHQREDEFALVIAKLDKLLADGRIDRFESSEAISVIGRVLAQLNGRAAT